MILKESMIRNITKSKMGYNVTLKRSQNGFRYFTTDWKNIPRFDKNGNQITPEEFKRQIIDKYGKIYWAQNYECEFLGSSDTLLDPITMKNFIVEDPLEIRDQILNIYNYPKENHRYILDVDPAKDGQDAFAIQIVDVTTINFEQVASANIQTDYFKMTEYVYNYGMYYNTALIIVENNEGAGQSIADFLRNDYEYENLFYDKVKVRDSVTIKPKKYAGFRTTTRTRRLILNNLKLFCDAERFKVVDKKTIQEFLTFININGKYQADEGFHDDSVMALALTFAPFTEARNFIDIKKMIEALESDNNEEEFEMQEFIDMGAFDDFTDEILEKDEFSYQGFI